MRTRTESSFVTVTVSVAVTVAGCLPWPVRADREVTGKPSHPATGGSPDLHPVPPTKNQKPETRNQKPSTNPATPRSLRRGCRPYPPGP
jgi:hypothetical protein